MEIGSWAEIIGGVVSIAGAVVSVAALLHSKQANKLAHEANTLSVQANLKSQQTLNQMTDATQRELDESYRAAEREQRERIASQVQAWWVRQRESGEFGVAIVNGAGGAAVFRHLEIELDYYGKTVRCDAVKTLPPGRFILRRSSNAGKADWSASGRWEYAQPLGDEDGWDPITGAKNMRLKTLSFTDPLGTSWVQSEDGRLSKRAG